MKIKINLISPKGEAKENWYEMDRVIFDDDITVTLDGSAFDPNLPNAAAYADLIANPQFEIILKKLIKLAINRYDDMGTMPSFGIEQINLQQFINEVCAISNFEFSLDKFIQFIDRKPVL